MVGGSCQKVYMPQYPVVFLLSSPDSKPLFLKNQDKSLPQLLESGYDVCIHSEEKSESEKSKVQVNTVTERGAFTLN